LPNVVHYDKPTHFTRSSQLEIAYREGGGVGEGVSVGDKDYKKDVEESMRMFVKGEVLRMLLRFREDRDCMSSVLRVILTIGEVAVENKVDFTDWLLGGSQDDGAFVVGLKMLWLARHAEGDERVFKWCSDMVMKTDDLRVISVAGSVVVKCLQVRGGGGAKRRSYTTTAHKLTSLRSSLRSSHAGEPLAFTQGEAS